MCGIVGVLCLPGPNGGPAAAADLPRLAEMSARIAHRGPDGDGLFADGPVALAHRRLAIIDLDGSAQPMVSASGRTVVVYNGEIYNYRALREELIHDGARLVSRGDTEVILALYEMHGIDGLERLRGMFAFALWDRLKQTLLLARDPVGIKPLIVERTAGRLAFASEAKALEPLRGPAGASLDPVAINEYFLRQYAGGRQTCVRGVERLAAGTVLEVDADGRTRTHRPWDAPLPSPARTAAQARDWLEDELSRAVRDHLESDVPVGLFLSGGLDSSTLVALARRHARTELSTFSVGFGDTGVDEVRYARRVAEAFGTRHHELHVGADEALAELPRIIAALDQPLADYAIVPTYAMSVAARRHVKVVLGGEGADEVFGGYLRRYLPFVAFELLGLERLGLRLPRLRAPLFSEADRRRLLADRFVPTSQLPYEASLHQHIETHRHHGAINAALGADLRGWLESDLLVKIDAMGMLASLEARVPYLDWDLVRRVEALPGSLKIGPRGTKQLLRDVAGRLLPADIVRRPKHGFTVPVASWLRGPLRHRFEEVALGGGPVDDWLDRTEVRRWWKRLLAGDNVGLKVWSLLVFAWWLREHQHDRVTTAIGHAGKSAAAERSAG